MGPCFRRDNDALICLSGLFNRPARAGGALREKSNLLRQIKLICPVQSRLQKYFCFSEPKSKLYE
jgi:hypothetical protein